MNYKKYYDIACERFPDANYDMIPNWNKVDMVNHIAKLLFIDSDVNSEFAIETRKQLLNLKQYGECCFDE